MLEFVRVFGRAPTKKESLVLNRLINLYGKEVVEEATRVSVVVTTGSPINYIAAVAKNLYDESKDTGVNYLLEATKKRLEEIQHYESSC